MESKARFLGHGLHPITIVFPLGLLATAAIFDVLYLVTGDGKWTGVSFYMIAAGIVGGIVAAVFGFIDWAAIPAGTRAKRVGLWHGLGNDIVLVLFAISWWLRRDDPSTPETLAFALSFLAVLIALVTGWMGGELVERLGVAVHPGAHLDAPNSLSGRPASEHESKR